MTVFESPEGFKYELFHLGYKPGDVAGLTRVTDGHGPLEDTRRQNSSGARIVRCKSPMCLGQWEAFFHEVRSVSAQEKMDELGAQLASMERIVTRITSPDAQTGFVKPNAQAAAAPHMARIQQKQQALHALESLPPAATVELAFKRKHSGGLIIRWLKEASTNGTVPVAEEAIEEPPAPPRRLTPEERVARRKKENERFRKMRAEKKKRAGEKASMSGESDGDGAAGRDGPEAAPQPVGVAR